MSTFFRTLTERKLGASSGEEEGVLDKLTRIDELLSRLIEILEAYAPPEQPYAPGAPPTPTIEFPQVITVKGWQEGKPIYFDNENNYTVMAGNVHDVLSYKVKKGEVVKISQIGIKLGTDCQAWLASDDSQVFPQGKKITVTNVWLVFNLPSWIEFRYPRTMTLKVHNTGTADAQVSCFLVGIIDSE